MLNLNHFPKEKKILFLPPIFESILKQALATILVHVGAQGIELAKDLNETLYKIL